MAISINEVEFLKDPTSAEIFGIDIRELENEPIDIDIGVKNRYEADLKINKQTFVKLWERGLVSQPGSKWEVKLKDPNL